MTALRRNTAIAVAKVGRQAQAHARVYHTVVTLPQKFYYRGLLGKALNAKMVTYSNSLKVSEFIPSVQ
jgi:L-amino acid N-acyltransferase YncA